MASLDLEFIVQEALKRIEEKLSVQVEASGRHVHLSREDVELLFGSGYKLTKVKELSQVGQYACKERVTLIGPKGTIKNVVVLGPERENTQIELSLTDALSLGVKAPIRESGNIKGSAPITIATEKYSKDFKEGVIVAKRHIHLCPKDAAFYNVEDKEIVKVKVLSKRPLIFDDVVIRVNENFRTFMHIDYDEANACGFVKGTRAKILK
ncbi:propanediol utilization protein [Clostridium drakei]|uniref:Phosphate propanoyltransferase n=2 Tax=Clostridium TaxID=1485 RepID=A0A0E3GQK7_CLOSL|nr:MULTISPECIES: ethanolamine utilization phosphate acetyltransferase EutD [Clostridium]AKA68741.1 ethanolamine utilization protein [Clostridium scatologenes]AWI05043.1 propanediol utilization protein [Clostridium drakei]